MRTTRHVPGAPIHELALLSFEEALAEKGAEAYDRERWLYLDLVFPAGKTLSWYSRIELAEGHVVSAPVPTAAAPSHLEGRTLDLARRYYREDNRPVLYDAERARR